MLSTLGNSPEDVNTSESCATLVQPDESRWAPPVLAEFSQP
jgi:hypothetical protein